MTDQLSSPGGSAFLSALYREHGNLLTRFAARTLGGDWHRAEDIVQEAAVRAWKHVSTLKSNPAQARPWLFTVVRNLVIDHHRARQARPGELELSDELEAAAADESEQVLTMQVVSEAMRDLNGQHREVLRQVYCLGNSVAQTSAELGIPPGTVKSRTHYAVRALREALASRGMHTY